MSDNLILLLLTANGLSIIGYIVCWILQIIAKWKIFQKADEPGWVSLVPIYNCYIIYKIAWKSSMFSTNLLMELSCFNILFSSNVSTTWPLIVFILANIIINIILCLKLSRAFDKGIGFTLGLLFLRPIFLLILGFGNAKYQGADL